MWLRIVSSLAAIAFLSGCCDLPFGPSEIAKSAPAAGGTWEREVTIQVLGPDLPADGVPIYVFWPDSANANKLYLMGLRSQDGKVVARVPGSVGLHAVAGTGAWTEEWLLDLVEPGTFDADATVRVYPRMVSGSFNTTWSGAAASVWDRAGQGSVAWMLQDVTPGLSNITRAGFAERLASLRANVTWTNTLTEQADLGVGAWHSNSEGLRCTMRDSHNELATLGTHIEGYFSTDDGYDSGAPCGTATPFGEDPPESPPEASLLVGPATGNPAVKPFGLQVTTNYTMEFGYPVGIGDLCSRLDRNYDLYYIDPTTGSITRTGAYRDVRFSPMPVAALVALGLLGAALVARKSRES